MNDTRDDDSTALTSRAALKAAIALKKAQRPWLVVVSGSGLEGRMYCLDKDLVIGRASASDVCLEGEGISRHHAKVMRTTEADIVVIDLESRNGTFVNGAPISRASLTNGDKIQVGTTTVLKFVYQDALDEEFQKNLFELATRDALTRLANRRTFTETLDREVSFARRHRRPLSVVLFDVDHFKRVNDTHGHAAGDEVLKGLAKVATKAVRREDLVARIGGEEFAVILRDTPSPQAAVCAERLRAGVESFPFVFATTKLAITVSIGVSELSDRGAEDAVALLALADERLYVAKKGGRNRVIAATTP